MAAEERNKVELAGILDKVYAYAVSDIHRQCSAYLPGILDRADTNNNFYSSGKEKMVVSGVGYKFENSFKRDGDRDSSFILDIPFDEFERLGRPKSISLSLKAIVEAQ